MPGLLSPAGFSFNQAGGRCEAPYPRERDRNGSRCTFCPMSGSLATLAPALVITARFTRCVKFRGQTIADVLSHVGRLRVSSCSQMCRADPQDSCRIFTSVGLSSYPIGPITPRHSPAARLMRQACRRLGRGPTLANNPCTSWMSPPRGLHFDDVGKLLERDPSPSGPGQHGDRRSSTISK